MSEVQPGEVRGSVAAVYTNARVTIYYNIQSGFSDTGRIGAIDGTWIELIKDNAERLLIPVAAIRILKILEPAKRNDGADILLRPADGSEIDRPPSAGSA